VSDQLFDTLYDSMGIGTPSHRVTLQYEDSQGVLVDLVERRDKKPLDKIVATTKSANNLLQAYSDARAFLTTTLESDAARLLEFWAYLTQGMKLIRIKTVSLSRALWIFETINQRGMGLDSMDLLKNLLFREAKSNQFETLKTRWKGLVDTLYQAGESPMRFIRHFILADYATTKIQADKVYTWITDADNAERPKYWEDPLGFVDELLVAAQAYVGFVDGKLTNGEDCRYLHNMWHLAHAARQHLVLLLAARRAPAAALSRLSEEIEQLYFVFLLTNQSPNKFESDFVDWAQQLRVMTKLEEVEAFIADTIVPRRIGLSTQFEFALRSLSEDNLPRYRLKYILGRMAQHIDEAAYGRDGSGDPLLAYMGRSVEIEHILPVKASQEAVDAFGGVDNAARFLHRLANLTLAEKPINAVAGNKPFEEKLPDYLASKFLLTKGLNQESQVGNNTSVNRALGWVHPYSHWNEESFKDREDALVKLACEVWGATSPPSAEVE
jgi:hypothetical protein